MRPFLIILFIFLSCAPKNSALKNAGYKIYLKTGDVIFRESSKMQHQIFTKISGTAINDCGIVEITDENVFVWFVSRNVKRIPIDEWLRLGKTPYFISSRLSDYNAIIGVKLKLALIRFKGIPEDFKYKWETKAVYNAEFVRKIYTKVIGTEITTLESQYIYNKGGSKKEFKNIVTPYQIYTSPFFVEAFNSFPKTVEEPLEDVVKDSIISNF